VSNFEFLRRYWSQLADLASLAENYLYTDPNSTMIKLGMFAEQIVAEIFAVENLKTPETDDSQAARIRTLKREGLLPSAIDDILYVIRKKRNDATHQYLDSGKDAATMLEMADAYGKETIRFNENSIVVTLPYQRLGAEVYGKESTEGIPSVIPQVKGEIPPVEGIIPQVIPPVGSEIPPVADDSVKTSQIQNAGMDEELSVETKILMFCAIPKGILEIAAHLGYKDKKTVRKYLKPLIDRGRIAMTIPESPNSNRQKYVTIK